MSGAGAGAGHCLAVSVSQVTSTSPTTVNPFPFGMQTLPLKTPPRVCRSPRSRRSRGVRYDQFMVIKSEAFFGKELSLSLGKVPRMLLVGFSGTLKLADGVRMYPGEIRVLPVIKGEGAKAREGDLVRLNYVCRRSNGYFVHSGESMPVTLPLDESLIIRGLKEVLIGMRVGGKRRALMPPSAGYIAENLQPIPEEFGPRRSLLSHFKEPLIFEVQLLKVL